MSTMKTKPIRNQINALLRSIERERAFTIDRVDRLRRFVRGRQFRIRQCKEWEDFSNRTGPMRREVDRLTSDTHGT